MKLEIVNSVPCGDRDYFLIMFKTRVTKASMSKLIERSDAGYVEVEIK